MFPTIFRMNCGKENRDDVKEKEECHCQACIDKDRIPVIRSLKSEMIPGFLSLWVEINHSLVTNTYIQGEYIVWFALFSFLVWDSNLKKFTKDSIELYRTTLIKELILYYEFFSPESLIRYEITYKIKGAGILVYNVMSRINPTLFYKWLKKDPDRLVVNLFVFAKKLLDIDNNCDLGNQLAIQLSRIINPDLILSSNSEGKLTIPDIGFIKPWNGHIGLTITGLSMYPQYEIKHIILNLLNDGHKVRIVKGMEGDDFFTKSKDTIRVNSRYFFFTHMLKLVKKS